MGWGVWGGADPHPVSLGISAQAPSLQERIWLGQSLCLSVLSDHREEDTSQKSIRRASPEDKKPLLFHPHGLQELLNLNSVALHRRKRLTSTPWIPVSKPLPGRGVFSAWIRLALVRVKVILAQSGLVPPRKVTCGQGFEVV